MKLKEYIKLLKVLSKKKNKELDIKVTIDNYKSYDVEKIEICDVYFDRYGQRIKKKHINISGK